MEHFTEEQLMGHLRHHGLKKALLRMCRDEDANTIRRAVEQMPDDRLARRIARALAPRKYDR